MTKIRKHTIELRSPKTEAAAEAEKHLAYLTEQTARRKKDALEGNLSAADLAAHTDELNLARLRADATREAADAETARLSDGNSIADAVAELLEDPAVSAAGVLEAATNLQNALSDLIAANDRRNTAIVEWADRLRTLGVPDTGLTVDDDEIRILSQGVTGTTISIGAGRIVTVPSVAGHIRHITAKHTANAHMAIDPSNLESADTRGRTRAATASVRLTRRLGGRAAGDILTTATHTPSVLAQMVHAGDAEHLDGELPEVSTRERTFIFVDSRQKGPSDYVEPPTAQDNAEVEAAVAKAFAI